MVDADAMLMLISANVDDAADDGTDGDDRTTAGDTFTGDTASGVVAGAVRVKSRRIITLYS